MTQTAPSTAVFLAALTLTLLLYAVIYSLVAVFVGRRFGLRALWLGWFLTWIAFTGLLSSQNFGVVGSGGRLTVLFMVAVFVGVPTLSVSALIARRLRKSPQAAWWKDALLATGLAMLSLLVAAILAFIPDFFE